MATSPSSLCNFLSFLLPSKPSPLPPPPPPQVAPFQAKKPKNGLVPLVSQEAPLNSSSSSSSSSLASVICPTLAYTNTLYFKSAYNEQVRVDGNEHAERLLNRFRRDVMRAGVIQELSAGGSLKISRTRRSGGRARALRATKELGPQAREDNSMEEDDGGEPIEQVDGSC